MGDEKGLLFGQEIDATSNPTEYEVDVVGNDPEFTLEELSGEKRGHPLERLCQVAIENYLVFFTNIVF